ncbi:MAG: PhzF family phenazine biosynthesis protein [Planctomycetales bacterium]|nr:PhzF family phenazine biosynthesis protein [Planctomycetales bacterium]
MKVNIVDSFTDVPFKGNPAGVCQVDTELADQAMLLIAQELGLSETAFVRPIGDAEYSIRYFSPKMEIPLCGHATLAAAKVVFSDTALCEICIVTRQQLRLQVSRQGDGIRMKFPVYQTQPTQAPPQLLAALGLERILASVFNTETKILMLEIESTELLAGLQPDFAALYKSHNAINGVLVTAASSDGRYDFHSRYFWPWSGTNEDPVTGGTHTFLAPYWAQKLGKSKLNSLQVSARSGFMEVELLNDQWLAITGQAVIVLSGQLHCEIV